MSQLVSYFLSQDILVSPDFLPLSVDCESFFSVLSKQSSDLPLVLTHDLYLVFSHIQKSVDVDWFAFDSSRVCFERGGDRLLYSSFLELLDFYMSDDQKMVLSTIEMPAVEVVSEETVVPELDRRVTAVSYEAAHAVKKTVSDFVGLFRARYEALKKILLGRGELASAVSISRLSHKPERESVCIIGLVVEKRVTKNENILLTLEDPSGSFNVLLNKTKEELITFGRDVVLDEVLGVVGVLGRGIIFANSVFSPDVPLSHELKKAPDEAYAAFITDVHFGCSLFYEEEFATFVNWLKGEYGTVRQRAIASRVKYLFISGDLIEGVGIYPGQEHDLALVDVVDQYALAAKYLSQIPTHITIILCAGNHDAMRIAEPQPIFDPTYAAPLFSLPNLMMVSNPSIVTIHASEDFAGFDVLMYHGFSFPYYADTVPSLAAAGGLERCDLIMQYLLQKRHLAPAQGSTLYLPDGEHDPLVIAKVPDFFISGHIHFLSTSSYRNVTLINAGCWAAQSDYQAKMGMVPNPCKVVLANLATRDVRVMDFMQNG